MFIFDAFIFQSNSTLSIGSDLGEDRLQSAFIEVEIVKKDLLIFGSLSFVCFHFTNLLLSC